MQPKAQASRARSVGGLLLALVSVTAQMVALGAASGWSPVLAAAHLPNPRMASSLVRGVDCGGAAASVTSCVLASTFVANPAVAKVTLPFGSKQCPDSAPGASCATGAASPLDFGAAAVPTGLSPCPTDPGKPVPDVPGACSDSPADGSSSPDPSPAPAVLAPAASKATDSPQPDELTLAIDRKAFAAGDTGTLVASSTLAVSGTPWAIEIFDETTGSLLGACSQSSQCTVAFAAEKGVHTFVAYVTPPSSALPASGVRLTSNTVTASWLGVQLAASAPTVVGTGHAVTFTAEASQDVAGSGYEIELWDTTSKQRLTYCTRGLSCSTALIEPTGGTRSVAADLALAAPADGLPKVIAGSSPVQATWMIVDLQAGATTTGGTTAISLNATASTDMTDTPWAIYIYTSDGRLVGGPCSAATCSATVNVQGTTPPSFYATIAPRVQAGDSTSTQLQEVLDKVRSSAPRPDVQARSASVVPSHIMWGVDSCNSYTDDPTGASGLLQQVTSMLGTPDFWGRYLPTTGYCPALSATEIAAAHARHMAILPIYNDYDCSAVSGNATSTGYAAAAVQLAQSDSIPLGTAIAIDIEPPGDACPGAGNVDPAFIQGWYDQLIKAGYVPAFYGNTSAGSAFANAWCASVQQRPEIATNAYLWSFEPSLLGTFSKAGAPAYSPYTPGCAGKYAAWQYTISAGATPDVDHDEATSNFPFWYP